MKLKKGQEARTAAEQPTDLTSMFLKSQSFGQFTTNIGGIQRLQAFETFSLNSLFYKRVIII